MEIQVYYYIQIEFLLFSFKSIFIFNCKSFVSSGETVETGR